MFISITAYDTTTPCASDYTGNYDVVKTFIQGSTNRQALGLVNFTALAYHFCLNLPAAFTQPGARLLVEPCKGEQSINESFGVICSHSKNWNVNGLHTK